jgi:phosphoglycerate-specific signal transduction histidine kinase
LNQRPIAVTKVKDEDLTILTPNSLLLGRSQNDNPGSWLDLDHRLTKQAARIQGLHQSFWKKWSEVCIPALIQRKKWNTEVRNLVPGDVVLIIEDQQIHAHYKLAQVTNVYPGADGKVRKVDLVVKRYKGTEDPGKPVYTGSAPVILKRAVQRLVLVLPVEELDDAPVE